MRYAAASVVSTTTSLVTLGVLVGLVGVAATWSNVIATAVGTVPSFELNRRWVWRSDGRRSLVRQVLPFCALSFTGLVADHTPAWGHTARTVAVLGANVVAYGTLWVVQYQLLNRYLFRGRSVPAASTVYAPGSTTSTSTARKVGDVAVVAGAPVPVER